MLDRFSVLKKILWEKNPLEKNNFVSFLNETFPLFLSRENICEK